MHSLDRYLRYTRAALAAALLLIPACAPKPAARGTAVPATVPSPAPAIAALTVARAGPAEIYPDSSRTPGVANPDIRQDNIQDNICSKKWSTKSIRPPSSYTTALKKKQMAAWGLSGAPSDYEEDHLVSLEAGGHPKDERNLWPESWKSQVNGKDLGARTKDLVESFIHDEICFDIPNHKTNSGKFKAKISVTLTRGQEILAQDWYACYQQMIAGGDCK